MLSQVILRRKLVIERKTNCEMLYHNLLDCDRKLTVCGTSVLLVERIIPAWDNGALSSDTPQKAGHRAKNACNTHVAPLGLGFFGIPVFYTHAAPLGLRTFTRECYLWKELFRQG